MKFVIATLLASLSMLALLSGSNQAGEKAKVTNADVMKKAEGGK